MSTPPGIIEIFLNPGEYYFGDRDTRIRTVLGSCVSLTLWHPKLQIGGMCHYMLPGRPRSASEVFDGKYADEALMLLKEDIAGAGTRLHEYEVKMFGGGNMFPASGRCRHNHIGRKNTLMAHRLMRQHGLQFTKGHHGGTGHRNVIFDVWSGEVWVKHISLGDEPGECPICLQGEVCYEK